MFVQDYRASKILFNFLKSNNTYKPFIIPANICNIIPQTFLAAEINFVIVDISNDNLCINQNKVIDMLKMDPDKYGGMLFVRTYGIDDSFSDFFEKVRSINNRFIIIDDACLCKPNLDYILDEFIDFKLFSTGYSKYIDIDYGGFGFIKNRFYYDIHDTILLRCNSLTKNKGEKEYVHLIQERLPKTIEHKKTINYIYSENLKNIKILDDKFQNWRFNILIPEYFQSLILKNLFNNGLFASSHYESIGTVSFRKKMKNTNKIHMTIINLFNDFNYSNEMALKSCIIINSTIKNN
jgi:hypothetical protein